MFSLCVTSEFVVIETHFSLVGIYFITYLTLMSHFVSMKSSIKPCSLCLFCLMTPISANLSTKGYSALLSEHPSGVYFGWAGLSTRGVYKMVMNIGWNPYFNNTEKSIVSLTLKQLMIYSYLNIFSK